jgi:sulfate adenylyltransferase
MPSWHPPAELLELAELVLSGALDVLPAPRDWPIDWPVGPATDPPNGSPIDLALEGQRVGPVGPVVLEDAEGTPVAVVWPRDDGAPPRLEPVQPFSQGPVRSARTSPDRVRAKLASVTGVLAVPVSASLSVKTVDAVLARAAESGQGLLWLAVFGTGRPSDLPPAALWRAVRELAEQAAMDGGRPSIAVPVAVPLLWPGPASGSEPDDGTLLTAVARAYGGTEVVAPADLAEAAGVVDSGDPHPAFLAQRDRAASPHHRGLTVFFTGLSGSGKSTVAKALAERIEEHAGRAVSLLDGDEVRRLLSAGLTFSRADRDLNIRRIGFVATEVTRHGGLAICAPIAPFAQARDQVRAAVEAVGDFVLIHVSTPLAECERRDRKGLYAQARQGLIPDFTGISSPYEAPVDADLRLDTAELEVTEAVDRVWNLLSARGYFPR